MRLLVLLVCLLPGAAAAFDLPCPPTCDLQCQNGGICVFCGELGGQCCICPPEHCGGLCQQMCTPTTTTAAATTTTSTTTETTSTTIVGTTTTSTTTATTTTTLVVQDSTSHVIVPFYPTNEVLQTFDLAHNNIPVCVRFQNPIGIASATSTALYQGRSPGIGEKMIWGVYPDDDNAAPLFSAAQSNSADNQVLRQTGLAGFSLTRGTIYRACVCVTNVVFFGQNASYDAAKWIANTGFASEQNLFVPSVGYATNACTGSGVPATTGAIIPDNSLRAPLILISTE